MKVLDVEKSIGIETFLTQFEGVGGKLRTVPEDFVVKEISIYPEKKEGGKFTIADVTTINWETNRLLKEISDRLHISRKRIGFAGTKDKRAKTTRAMSFYKVDPQRLSSIKIHNVSIENIYQSDKPIKIGDLIGNNFEIIVRGIRPFEKEELDDAISLIKKTGGFPNFFGIQRFGVIRPITHIIGKNIIKGDFEKAVMTYIANPLDGEDEEIIKVRKELEETYDYAKALKSYPNQLVFEKAMLNKLALDPKDFASALKELPTNLLTMFVYAYQSYLFNRILSERIKRKLPLNRAIIGDIVLPMHKNLIEERYIPVKESNIEKVNEQISKGKAVVSGILFGSDSVFCEGEMGEIEHKILEEEKIDLKDFIVPDIPYLSSTGSRRPLIAPIWNLEYRIIDDDLKPGNKALLLRFTLHKGCYATSFLREIVKADDIRDY